MDNDTMARKQDPEVRSFILQNVEVNPGSVASMAAQKFGLTRASIARYMGRLVQDGILDATGNTKARQYSLHVIADVPLHFERDGTWNEDTLWRDHVRPLMKNVSQNIIDLFQYGVTEMINNVIDHSETSAYVSIKYRQTYNMIEIVVDDHGIGIFNKIQRDFRLSDPRTALLELSKGKLTSDRKRHSGEGIYFTSRMFDSFAIMSGHLCYLRTKRHEDDWLIEATDKTENVDGTFVRMRIKTNADWTMREVFDKYQGDDIYFRKTHVPVALGRYPGEQLISRSQAKRILARFNEFSEVLLDFHDVREIGQAFADEIFRVFKGEHPGTALIALNANEDVEKMIKYVQSNGDSVASPPSPS